MPRVDLDGRRAAREVLERQEVRFGQVDHVDVVANRGAVGRRVVGAEDLQLAPAPQGRLDGERNQVRLRVVIFADFAFRVGPRGIEIAQRRVVKVVGALVPLEDFLDHELGFAVRIHRLLQVIFSDGDVGRLAVGGAGRREHDVAHAVVDHRVEEVQRVHHVVAEIFARIADRFTHVGIGGKMDDRGHAVLLDHLARRALIGEISLDEGAPLTAHLWP